MSVKKLKKNKLNRVEIVKAFLFLAKTQDLTDITLRDIADKANVHLASLHDHFEDKYDILTATERMIDKDVLSSFCTQDEEFSSHLEDEPDTRERLFDLFMFKFETMNEYRPAFLNIFKGFKSDPKQAVIVFPNLCKSMHWYLEAAGIQTNGIKGVVKIAGLSGVYLKTLRVWMSDETPDLSQTMAELDKNLGRIENLAQSFGF